ncbi:MAG: MscL family protein, partial [Duncaniella dubosii]|nr:MscL family protein [Duncaniella dubosii]
LNWGTWIQTIVDFLIVAFCIFVAIKAINQLKRKEKAAPEPEAAPEPTKEEVLLTEIRDILKEKEAK